MSTKSDSSKTTEAAKPELTPEQQLKELKKEIAGHILAAIACSMLCAISVVIMLYSYISAFSRHDEMTGIQAGAFFLLTACASFGQRLARFSAHSCATSFAKVAKLLANNPGLTVEEEPKKKESKEEAKS